MKCDLIEGSADGKPPAVVACQSRDWRGLLGEIFAMRQCNASMAGACDQWACFGTWHGLESVKKTHQVAGVGKGSYTRPDFSAATGRRKPAAV
jgi:hypothetical protein